MKYNKYIFILLALSSPGYTQTDTLEALSYFPLQTGNSWQYEGLIVIDPPVFTTYTTYSVLGDSMMPNGKTYKIIENNLQAFRIDTAELKVYVYEPYSESCPDSELVYFDLNLPDSGSYNTCFPYPVSVDSGSGVVGSLSPQAPYLYYRWYDGINYTYKLSKGFGISEWSWWEGGGGEYTLVASIINGKQYGTFVTGIPGNMNTTPQIFLYQNQPNPFNPSTTIRYHLPMSAVVKINICDISGRVIKTLVNERQTAGMHSVSFDASNLAGGIYLYTLKTGASMQSRKMLLLR